MTAAGDGVEKPSFLARWTKVINEAPRRGPAVEDSPAATDIVERLRDEASGQRAAFSMGIDAPAVCPITLDAAADLIDRLRAAVKEFHWTGRRYCDGRMSSAPCSFNSLVRQLLADGIPLSEPLFARDGMGRAYDGLTDAEAAAAQADMPKGHAALEAEWMARTEALRAALRECADDLASEIAARYPAQVQVYPSEKRRYDRDMEPVRRARELLK